MFHTEFRTARALGSKRGWSPCGWDRDYRHRRQLRVAMADCAARGNEFLLTNVGPALGKAHSKIATTLRVSD